MQLFQRVHKGIAAADLLVSVSELEETVVKYLEELTEIELNQSIFNNHDPTLDSLDNDQLLN